MAGSCISSYRLPYRILCSSEASVSTNDKKLVLIVGGTGRVGSSAARALAASIPNVQLAIAGRNRERGEALASSIGTGSKFVQVDIDDMKSLELALVGVDLVVHAAGPFQRKESCSVLDAAIGSKVPYIDVCDDTEYAQRAKTFHERAVQSQVPALITTGIYPGISNIMAAELIRMSSERSPPDLLRYSYYTAGSGGIGPTILATSFHLLGEDVLTFVKGKIVKRKPYSGEQLIDFGKGIGKRSVYLLNLPEVVSSFKVLDVPTVTARFGTSPFFWNWAMAAIAAFVPKDVLNNREKVESLAKFSFPALRAVDGVIGQRMSMRVDLQCADGTKTLGLFTHKKLSVCVGTAVSAFARAVLEGHTLPGVWFPEEEGIAVEHRQILLERASKGALNFMLNKAPWMVESVPKEIGFGIYLE